jgi:hypothetical protein
VVTKDKAAELIKAHKNDSKMVNPVDLLNWTWLYVIVSNLTEDEWNAALMRALPTLSS